jgi:hypothetical protein
MCYLGRLRADAMIGIAFDARGIFVKIIVTPSNALARPIQALQLDDASRGHAGKHIALPAEHDRALPHVADAPYRAPRRCAACNGDDVFERRILAVDREHRHAEARVVGADLESSVMHAEHELLISSITPS